MILHELVHAFPITYSISESPLRFISFLTVHPPDNKNDKQRVGGRGGRGWVGEGGKHVVGNCRCVCECACMRATDMGEVGRYCTLPHKKKI